MGKRFFYKAIRLAALFLVLALHAGAVEKPCPETAGKKTSIPGLTASSKPCGEIDLTASQPVSNQAQQTQQTQKKASTDSWANALKTADSIIRKYSIIRRVDKSAGSYHLEYIFPSHYFW